MPDPTRRASTDADPTRKAPKTPTLSSLLLDGKLRVRATSPRAVSRSALIRASRSSAARIVGVTAPAGYGKSTMLAEWASIEQRHVGWASIDRFDDDPASMLTVLAAACATLSPRAGEVVSQMRGVGASVLGRAAPMLAAVLAQAPEPFVLFIDDIHAAGTVECQDVLEVVLAGVPEGSQVVLASRHEQPYFARLRAAGGMREIVADDLRIDQAGAEAIFAAANVNASAADVAIAVEHCEGWPTGLFLCALAVGSGADVRTLTGDERFVADYLYRECVATLPEDLRVFLRRTAVLEQLSGPLCDAVLGTEGSREILRRLEQLNLFLVPLDRHREWFRYHALFREFLLTELQRFDDGIRLDLHRRAADWLLHEGAPAAAIEHLLVAGASEQAIVLVADLAMRTYEDGQVALVERWLAKLGDSVVETSPDAAIIAAWAAILQGKSPASERWAAVLERMTPAGTPEELLTFESGRAMIRAAMCTGGPRQALQDALFAVASEPEWSAWRDQALHLLGSAWLLVGEPIRARDAFMRASASARDADHADTVVLSEAELAILCIDDGRWADAEIHSHAAVRAIDDSNMEGYPTTALALAVQARVALRRGDAVAADRYLTRAMRARVHCTHVLPYLAMRSRLQLAMVFAGQRDHAAALHMLREIDELRARRPHVGVLAEQIDQFRAKLSESAARIASVPLTPAELRLLPYLQTHLTIAEIGKRLFVSRNTVSSQVGSIYRKLGVTTRAAAVDEAIAGGLLGE
ncbi:LuxR C-terminal-related transcriptional regulator [Microbacterium sp. H1-D42]|uniref:LuxR C-terminal-related transcriptional regulator n=1 Tax=Microbacterium sp. H1-D42 TaxID=2925844 RepID=UPI001F52C570|nr:LuxR C-terminal-related transcriptional regulator [Microbacterium sp. H1-D42]UNK70288.1 LuxR C-terminal-related transcriptional regulator [Microbacterium sp. H1-D42]